MIFNISYFVDLQPFAKKLQKRPKTNDCFTDLKALEK